MIVSYERMISTSNKCTQKTTLFKKGAFSGDPKGVAPKTFFGGYAPGPPKFFTLRARSSDPAQTRARAGDCHALGWIRPWSNDKKDIKGIRYDTPRKTVSPFKYIADHVQKYGRAIFPFLSPCLGCLWHHSTKQASEAPKSCS